MLLISDWLYTCSILGRSVIQYIILLTFYTYYLCYFVAYFRVSILFHYSVIVKANSGYINSDYNDVRYRLYM